MRNAVLVKNDTIVKTRKDGSIFERLWPVFKLKERRL